MKFDRTTRYVFGLLLMMAAMLSGCTSAPWQVAPLANIQAVVQPNTSTLPAYDLTAAVWVENQPLLVNKDFNFGMAMSMEGVGVAIAAGMRINKNKALAASLAELPPLNLAQQWQDLASNLKTPLKKYPVFVYALLYGQPQAHLRTIVEFQRTDDDPIRFIDVSPWRPVAGENSWVDNNGEKLKQQSIDSLTAITDMISTNNKPEGNEINYTISGGEAVQRGRGYILSQNSNHTIIQSTVIPHTMLRIPSEVVSIMEKIEPPLPPL